VARKTAQSSTPREAEYVWPRYATGPEKHMHALGVIAVNYNVFEFGLALLLEHYATRDVSDYFFGRINNQERLDAIKHFASARERDPAVLALVEHLIAYFSACTANRNILMHSRRSEGDHPGDVLPLEKQAAHEPSKLLYFHLLLPQLRRVADQIMRGVTFMKELLKYLQDRDATSAPATQQSLPKAPRSPRTLSPAPPVAIPIRRGP
jgi:hypothetical protein